MKRSRRAVSIDSWVTEKLFTEFRPRFKEDMQLKEWQRGFNTAYFENLSRIKKDEQLRKGS